MRQLLDAITLEAVYQDFLNFLHKNEMALPDPTRKTFVVLINDHRIVNLIDALAEMPDKEDST